jgi:hypothetical protein
MRPILKNAKVVATTVVVLIGLIVAPKSQGLEPIDHPAGIWTVSGTIDGVPYTETARFNPDGTVAIKTVVNGLAVAHTGRYTYANDIADVVIDNAWSAPDFSSGGGGSSAGAPSGGNMEQTASSEKFQHRFRHAAQHYGGFAHHALAHGRFSLKDHKGSHMPLGGKFAPHHGPHGEPHRDPHGDPHGTTHGDPHGTTHGDPHGTTHGDPHGSTHGGTHATPHGDPHGAPHITAPSSRHVTRPSGGHVATHRGR